MTGIEFITLLVGATELNDTKRDPVRAHPLAEMRKPGR
jgi:hypothetical protein